MAQRPFDVSRTRITLFDALLRARREAGARTPVLEDHDRKVLSYNDIVRGAFALGGKLKGQVRRGERVVEMETFSRKSTMETAGLVKAAIDKHGSKSAAARALGLKVFKGKENDLLEEL